MFLMSRRDELFVTESQRKESESIFIVYQAKVLLSYMNSITNFVLFVVLQ